MRWPELVVIDRQLDLDSNNFRYTGFLEGSP